MKKKKRSQGGGGAVAKRRMVSGKRRALKAKRSARAAVRRSAMSPKKCFRIVESGGRGVGFGVAAGVVEGFDDTWDVAEVVEDRTVRSGRGGRGSSLVGKRLGRLASKNSVAKSAEILAALGHPVRIAILVKLLDGPASYRELQEYTGVKAGPLYHHVNQLRLAKLVLPKKRDLYAMSRGGRNALLLSLVLPALAKDGRARPEVRR